MKAHSTARCFVVLSVALAVCALCVGPVSAEAPPARSRTDVEQSGFVAYYFHGHMRCATCRKIEAYSEEAIKTGFAAELAEGRLVWLAVNTDEDHHRHFVTDFELVTKSLVLVEYSDGEVVRFENLDRIWKLVADREAFIEYVRSTTREFIGSK